MNANPLILAVNSNPHNLELLVHFLAEAGYQASGALTIEEANLRLAGAETPSLALVDIAGFGQHIWAFCETLRSKQIPFLVISPRYSNTLQQESLAWGARGILVKPLTMRELLALVKTMLDQNE